MIVEWTTDALDLLADIYVRMNPTERDDLEKDVLRINSALAKDPHRLGESRNPGQRVWFTGPLMVYFSVKDDVFLVTVLYVVRLRKSAIDSDD